MSAKALLRQHPAQRDDIRDLVTRRPLPGPALEQVDPFLRRDRYRHQRLPGREIRAGKSGVRDEFC